MNINKRVMLKRKLRKYGLHDVSNLDDKMLLKLEKLVVGMVYFTCDSVYYFNGHTIPNNGKKYPIKYAADILEFLQK